MAYLSRVSYTGNNSTVDYSIPFSYIISSHIYAWLDNVATTAFTVSGSTLTFTTAPGTGVAILIKRVTPTDARLVDFTDGSVLTEQDLDQSADQNFYIAQESSDEAQLHLSLDNSNKYDAESKQIINVADPSANQHAVTKYYLENTWLSSTDKANLTSVAGVASEIALLGTTDAIADMNLIGSADFVSDLNTVASADFVSDLNTLATADVVSDMNTLGTAGNVTAMDTCATNITGINSFADRYRVGSANPTGSLDDGDLFFNTSDNALKYYNGSSWASITAGIGSLADDTTPELGGDLSLNGNNIDFPTTANISDCLDEDNMASDSATKLATQQSIKAYADTKASTGDATALAVALG